MRLGLIQLSRGTDNRGVRDTAEPRILGIMHGA